MATIPALLLRLRRTRRRVRDPPSAGQFAAYEEAYREIFTDVRSADEEAADALCDWAVEWTEEHERLPPPETLRAAADEMLE